MKTLHKCFKLITGVAILASIVISCIPKTESMGDAGQTLIKLHPDGFNLVALDAVSTEQRAVLFEVRRDAHSEAALSSLTTVVLQKDDALLDAYNTKNGTAFIPLPESLGITIPAADANGKVTLEFVAGDFTKGLVVKVPDATQFDFAEQYGLAYKILSVSGTGKISEAISTEVVVQVLVKNKYDGVYTVTALSPMVDVLNANLTGYYPFTYKLETSGSHSCLCFDSEIWGDYMHPIMSGSNISGYGSFGLEVFFDPSGNGDIINLMNPWGNPPSSTRMPVLDPSGVNKWDPVTHDIQIKYWMIQPSLIPDPPHIRVYFDEYWTYKGPR
ncbi:MAG: DUF1735 domain-containing protein [Bacteroidales bacterium]